MAAQDLALPPSLVEPPDPSEGKKPITLTTEQRRAVLGKLIDFEIKLSALPGKQAAFVLAVLHDPHNPTRAARTAGYVNAEVAASTLRHNARVVACIALGENVREDRTLLTTDRTLHEYAIIAFSNISDFFVDEDGRVTVREGVPAYMLRAISQVQWEQTSTQNKDGTTTVRTNTKIRLWSKTEALRMLAVYQNLINPETGAPAMSSPLVNVTVNLVAPPTQPSVAPPGPVRTVEQPP